jgi:hypothetical protein
MALPNREGKNPFLDKQMLSLQYHQQLSQGPFEKKKLKKVLVAPTGINPKTGVLNPSNNLEKVYLILARSNTSDIVGNPEDLNLSDYHKYVNDSAKRIGCKVLSNEFVKLNGINSERVTGKCGPIEEMTMLTYAIASGKNVIFVGLKGLTSAFDYNHEDFMRSLKTIKVDDQSDIKALIFRSYPPE